MHAFKSSTQDKTKYKGQKKEYIKKKKKKTKTKDKLRLGRCPLSHVWFCVAR
jgi:hypothetical protein